MTFPCRNSLTKVGGQGWTRTNEAEAVNLQSTAIATMRPAHIGKVLPTYPVSHSSFGLGQRRQPAVSRVNTFCHSTPLSNRALSNDCSFYGL